MKPILEVKNLSLNLNLTKPIPILLNLDFQILESEIFSLVGESGCGKSLTSLALTRLLPEKQFSFLEGEVNYKNTNILKVSNEHLQKLRGKEIAYIFQDPFVSLNPLLKIKDQIIESYLLHISNNQKEAIEKAEFILDTIGITDLKTRLDNYPNQLSGGMLQRVCIAMALMCDPKLLIADEPTSALDVTIQSQLIELLLKIQSDTKMSILFISHDLPLVSNISNRMAVMYAGQIVEMGVSQKIISSPSHPYTNALIQSIPNQKNKKKKLEVIDGIVPSPKDYPQGCHFYQRCNFRLDRCMNSKPNTYTINKQQQVACFLKEKKSVKSKKS